METMFGFEVGATAMIGAKAEAGVSGCSTAIVIMDLIVVSNVKWEFIVVSNVKGEFIVVLSAV
jgi:hypothetical protein